jgi:hypothetical protein
MPAATAAAAATGPARRALQCPRVAGRPHASGWVVGRLPISGPLVRPAMTSPAALNRATSVVSAESILPACFSARLPLDSVWPVWP